MHCSIVCWKSHCHTQPPRTFCVLRAELSRNHRQLDVNALGIYLELSFGYSLSACVAARSKAVPTAPTKWTDVYIWTQLLAWNAIDSSCVCFCVLRVCRECARLNENNRIISQQTVDGENISASFGIAEYHDKLNNNKEWKPRIPNIRFGVFVCMKENWTKKKKIAYSVYKQILCACEAFQLFGFIVVFFLLSRLVPSITSRSVVGKFDITEAHRVHILHLTHIQPVDCTYARIRV